MKLRNIYKKLGGMWEGDGGGTSAFGLAFWAPLNDSGSGAVNLVLARGTGAATFTRATTATTVNSSGIVVSVGSGVARSYYDPATLTYRGYLAEEARTNLQIQSQFAATWATSQATLTANAVTSPDGGTTGATLADNAIAANHVTSTPTLTKAASQLVYTFSVFAKQGTLTWIALVIDDGTASNGSVGFFNLATGVVGSITNGSVYAALLTGTALSIKAYPNGWYRCSLKATSTAGTGIRPAIGTANGDTIYSYLGSGKNVQIYGAQFEQAGFASSYVPTTTAAVTRNADVLTFPSAGNVASGAANTLYVEATPTVVSPSAFQVGPQVDDGTANNRLLLSRESASANAYGQVVVGGVSQAKVEPAVTIAASTMYKLALAASTTRIQAAINTTLGTAGSGTMPGGLTTIRVDNDSTGTVNINGAVKNLKVWSRALTNAELVGVTR